MKLFDDLIVLRIVLKAAAGVDCAGDAETIELAHEVARRIDLIVERQFWPLCQRCIEDRRVGLGEQQSGRLAARVADYLSARGLWRVAGVAAGAQRRTVEERTIVEMQHEYRRFRGDGIDLIDGR